MTSRPGREGPDGLGMQARAAIGDSGRALVTPVSSEFKSPLGHDPYPHVAPLLYIVLRADGDFGPDFCFSGLEGDLEVELVVDGCLLGGPGVADDVAQVAEGGDEGADVVVGEPAAGVAEGLGGVAGEGGGAVGFDLAGPLGDGLGIGSGVEGGLVA